MPDERGFHFTIPASPGPLVEISFADLEKRLLARLEAEHESPDEALWQLVTLYSRAGQQDQAEAYLCRLIERSGDPESRGRHLLALGQLEEQRGDFGRAVRFYRQGLACEPRDPWVGYFLRNNLGYSLNTLGEHAEAEALCRAAIAIEPVRANAHKNLGISLAGQGRLVEAAHAYAGAVRADATDPRGLQHLEALLEAHPELGRSNPELLTELESCREGARVVTLIERHHAPKIHRGLAGKAHLLWGDLRRWWRGR